MKKLNWGWGIVFLYGGFMTLILFLVWKTTTVKDDLVTPDYYARELKIQEKIDKQHRTQQLTEQPVWNVSDNKVEIKFPADVVAKKVTADILFYSPSEAKRDVKVSCSPDARGICEVEAGKLSHGVYQLQMDWTAGGVAYYNEGTINIR